MLAAEVGGEMYVAVSLTDLHTVADPFRFTTEVRAITLARAEQLLGAAPSRRRRLPRLRARQAAADPSPRPQGAM